MATTEYSASDVPALREAIVLLRQELAEATKFKVEIELSTDFNALDAVEACENFTAAAREIDVDGYRVMMGSDDNKYGEEFGGYGVPVDTIGALQAALVAVELARTLVRRDMGDAA